MTNKYKINGISFVQDGEKILVEMNQGGVDVIYPIKPIKPQGPVKYVLMDLDGTSVKSEEFWIYLIECTTKEMLGDPNFKLSEEDAPYVSGFTTYDHLSYCKKKYGFKQSINEADKAYHRIARRELGEIMEGRGNVEAFKPRPGLKEFLLHLHQSGIKVGLATSGLDYKAIPEVVSTFKVIGLGDPLEYYDAIITGGRQKNKGEYGTIGELAVKPHPWIYRELALGLDIENLEEAVVLEDSSAGVLSGRLASMNVIGFKDGNLYQSGLDDQCIAMVDTFEEVEKIIGIL
ncbi:MAG: HAD family phosphatase [Bacilli bacterium]|nr:HAD family phosphatase [Bacilli bacterium]